jgi:hypothetical protein
MIHHQPGQRQGLLGAGDRVKTIKEAVANKNQ